MVRNGLRRLVGPITALVLAGCALPAESPPNFVLVVIDTLRADRLGCYGNQRGLTPFLDSLAERSFVFRRAYAQSSWTNPSVASLLTSRYPSQHGVIGKPSSAPVPGVEELTLAEALAARGYATAAFVANGALGGFVVGGYQKGFAQGFEAYEIHQGRWVPPQGKGRRLVNARAAEINQSALAWLAKRPKEDARPVFLYLHYMEPHTPYGPSAKALARVGRDRSAVDKVNARNWMWNREDVTEEDLRDLRDVYDAEVASVDADLADLLAGLRARGVLDHAVVLVTADHGEELRGHGAIGHGGSLYEALIHVPLLVSFSGATARVDVDEVVSHIDLAPTLLEWAGGPAEPRFEGRSLRPLMARDTSRWRRWLAAATGAADEPEVAFSELFRGPDWPSRTGHRVAAIASRAKVIVGDAVETYDPLGDPGEEHPGGGAPADLASLRVALAGHRVERDKGAAPGAVAERALDAAAEERLRALGYDW